MKQAATLFLPFFIIISGLAIFSTNSPIYAKNSLSKQASPQKKADGSNAISTESLYQIMAAEMALDREQPETALANYIAAAKETQDPQIAARATQVALTVAPLEAAIEPALIWAKKEKNNLEAQITLAALYIRLDQISRAIPFLYQAEIVNKNEAFQYYLILFRQLQKEEDNKRVIKALEALAKIETEASSGHLALAEIYLYLGKEKAAFEMSEAALKIDPKSSLAIQLCADSMLKSKGKLAAKEFLTEKMIAKKQDIPLQQYYTQFLFDNGFKEEARLQIESMTITMPSLGTEELLQLARLSIQGQWYDIAQRILKQTSQKPETKDLSYYFLARVAEMQDKNQEAIEWFKQVLTGPFHALSQIRASMLLVENKQYEQALEILSHAQPSDSIEKKQIILATVDVLNHANRYTESLNLLDENINSMPDEVDLHYAKGLVADHLGSIDIAEVELKKILVLQPNHLDALNALGFLLANKTNRYEEAKKYLTQAIKLSPNNASVLDSIGWLYYKMGDYKKSLEALKRASSIMPDAEIAAHLGEVMWQMKDFEGAKRVWYEALEQNPKHENIIDAMQRLMPKK